MSQRQNNALVVSPKASEKSSISKSPSFALSDLDSYRRAFHASDHEKCGNIAAHDIIHVASRLGYRISSDQMAVGGTVALTRTTTFFYHAFYSMNSGIMHLHPKFNSASECKFDAMQPHYNMINVLAMVSEGCIMMRRGGVSKLLSLND